MSVEYVNIHGNVKNYKDIDKNYKTIQYKVLTLCQIWCILWIDMMSVCFSENEQEAD